MKRKPNTISRNLFASATLLCALMLSHAEAVIDYTVTDLGPSYNFGAVTGISNSGIISGYLDTTGSSLGFVGFTYDTVHGTYQFTGLAIVTAISGDGQLATGFPTTPRHPFIYANGVTTEAWDPFDELSAYSSSINDYGQIVGRKEISPGSPNTQAFFRDTNGIVTLITLGGETAEARGINNAGQVVGFSRDAANVDQAFLYSSASNVLEQLPTFGGGAPGPGATDGTRANAINASGQITGYSTASNGVHAFMYDGTLHDLDPSGMFGFSEGAWINSSGQIVGFAASPGYYTNFVYDSTNGMRDLGHLIDPLLGLQITAVHGITDAGQILANGKYGAYGDSHALLLTPTPEPTTAVLLLGGGALLALRRRRSPAGA